MTLLPKEQQELCENVKKRVNILSGAYNLITKTITRSLYTMLKKQIKITDIW